MEEISEGKKVNRQAMVEILDTYQFLPIKLKRDKNRSENLYYILNSNKRGQYQTKEEILLQMKENNDKKHLAKIMTLIAIKIEEKFHTLAKAFLSFDSDSNQTIEYHEFTKGIEKLRIKLSKKDLDLVFEHMD